MKPREQLKTKLEALLWLQHPDTDAKTVARRLSEAEQEAEKLRRTLRQVRARAEPYSAIWTICNDVLRDRK